jgi:pimeloyl-ACP methyl ester carboxylesterase
MTRFTTSTGIELHYDDWGQGRPLVFIHGGALNADIWEYQTVPLSEDGFRVIAYDQRGCGRSETPHDGYRYEDLAGDLDDLLTHCDVRDAVLVAHSMAGGTVARYLTKYGTDRIGGVVLICPTTPMLVQTDDNPDGLPAAVFEQSLELLAVDRPRWIALSAPAFFGRRPEDDGHPDELVAWGTRLAEQSSGKATRGLVGSFWKADLRSEMASFTVPTLILHGEHDLSAPLELTGRRTAAAIAGSTLKIYPGGSHGIMLSHAAEVTADIAAFARR